MSAYLKSGRLADVLALIQVLALDEASHRSESGLQAELEGPPRSASEWVEVAEAHREFFRLAPDATHRVSLVARHVTPDDEHGNAWLPADYAGKLLALAVDLHDREERRSQRWIIYAPAFAALAAVFSSIAAWVAALHHCQ
jgi:Flp pilus assembly protein CpaB